MSCHPVRRMRRHAAVVLSLILLSFATAAAQQNAPSERNLPGRFDFYVLALSWSPSYCAEVKERGAARLPQPQCGGRPFAFVVHGLWPQYVRGFPSFCQKPAPRIERALVDSMLDLMPSPELVYYEWNRHGTCSGLSAPAYFAALRKARAAVKVPPDYLALDRPITVKPGEVVDAFLKANPGLRPANFAVACDKTRLTEVRICLAKDFSFHDCAEIVRRACRRDKLMMSAVRGG
jgi:ribonuclease T2